MAFLSNFYRPVEFLGKEEPAGHFFRPKLVSLFAFFVFLEAKAICVIKWKLLGNYFTF